MNETQNSILARRWFQEVWNEGREETVHELLAPDAVGHLEGLEAHGVAEFLPMRNALLGAFKGLKVTVENTVAQGDSVVVRWSAAGNHNGPDLGIASTGEDVTFRGMTWLRFADGRIAEGWDAWNQGKLVGHLRAVAQQQAAKT
jgi:steroid delta-isomerase-like uncharacterized protein